MYASVDLKTGSCKKKVHTHIYSFIGAKQVNKRHTFIHLFIYSVIAPAMYMSVQLAHIS